MANIPCPWTQKGPSFLSVSDDSVCFWHIYRAHYVRTVHCKIGVGTKEYAFNLLSVAYKSVHAELESITVIATSNNEEHLDLPVRAGLLQPGLGPGHLPLP